MPFSNESQAVSRDVFFDSHAILLIWFPLPPGGRGEHEAVALNSVLRDQCLGRLSSQGLALSADYRESLAWQPLFLAHCHPALDERNDVLRHSFLLRYDWS